LCGASCGLLVFSAMILCGLLAANPAEIIVLRALGGLFTGFLLGLLVGWIGTLLMQENVEITADQPPDKKTDHSPVQPEGSS